MVSYKELGLVNTKEMFAKAIKGGYAIPAFNFNNMEQLQAIIQAAVATKSPVILQVSKGARQYANQTLLRYMAEGAVEYAKELGLRHRSALGITQEKDAEAVIFSEERGEISFANNGKIYRNLSTQGLERQLSSIKNE